MKTTRSYIARKIASPLLITLLLLQFGVSYAELPKIGDDAPPIKLLTLLQTYGKLEENLQSLKGKVVVLEFWATWCAPCIGAMPHLNKLSEKYADRGVQFISITRESEDKAKRFLQKRKIAGWVGIDFDGAMNEAYDVKAIPFTVVIGPNGKILGYPSSQELSEDMLDKALLGKEIMTPKVEKTEVVEPIEQTEKKAPKPIYELSISPSESESTFRRIMPKVFETKGASALQLIQAAFDTELKHNEVIAQLPEGKFDAVATNPSKSSPKWHWRKQLQSLLQEVWDLEIKFEKKEVEVYELVTTPSAKDLLIKADPEAIVRRQSTDEGILAAQNTSIATLAKTLERSFKKPILDATGLEGNFDYNLYYEEGNPETLINSLEEEMGLKLKSVVREIEFLVIAPKE